MGDIYRVWIEMKARCLRPTHKDFKNYGARGIKVCDRWVQSFEDFLADMGPRPRDFYLERIDNSKGYNPENCKWASADSQAQNRRNTKLTRVTVDEIRTLASQGFSIRDIALVFAISPAHIHRIILRKTWR